MEEKRFPHVVVQVKGYASRQQFMQYFEADFISAKMFFSPSFYECNMSHKRRQILIFIFQCFFPHSIGLRGFLTFILETRRTQQPSGGPVGNFDKVAIFTKYKITQYSYYAMQNAE